MTPAVPVRQEGRRPRVVVFLNHDGFVRNFDPVLRDLAKRGTEVHLFIDQPGEEGSLTLASELAAAYPSVKVALSPESDLSAAYTELAGFTRAAIDGLRYYNAEYADAPVLRAGAFTRMPAHLRSWLDKAASKGEAALARRRALCRVVERALPAVPSIDQLLRRIQPDVVLVSPLVRFQTTAQVDYVKAAQRLGIPTGLCVASWDNLTNKGLMRLVPDRIFVWNEAQKREAVEMHGAAPDQVIVTGAQIFDHWFEWKPTRSRDVFCARVGLDPAKPYILYLCSSRQVAPDEFPFVARWLRLLRSSEDARVRGAGVLIRPHPAQQEQWQTVDVSSFGNAHIWPRERPSPLDPDLKADYFDSMYYGAATVGINTSGQIEAGILNRPVLTWQTPDYPPSQGGTLHVRHLVDPESGLLHVADTEQRHLGDVSRALANPDQQDARSLRFVKAFVRPHGLDQPATPLFVEGIQQLAGVRAGHKRRPIWAPMMAPFLMAAGNWIQARQNSTTRANPESTPRLAVIQLIASVAIGVLAPIYRLVPDPIWWMKRARSVGAMLSLRGLVGGRSRQAARTAAPSGPTLKLQLHRMRRRLSDRAWWQKQGRIALKKMSALSRPVVRAPRRLAHFSRRAVSRVRRELGRDMPPPQ